jgi:hypothetical protein
MPTHAIELNDAGFTAARAADGSEPALITGGSGGALGWPGFAVHDANGYRFGRPAEDEWLVHPRRVSHTFWSRLAHEPSGIGPAQRPAPRSELAFHFLRDFLARSGLNIGQRDQVALAVPGNYLKDAATEEERIGLLLGMAHELRLPLAGLIDAACASLCDPRSDGFDPSLPVVVLDLQLEGADLTLVTTEGHLARANFVHLPNSGHARLQKQLLATMGNRFLRHTAFDILADGRIEQLFFRQTKDFLLSGAPDHRFQLNTADRTYEMSAKRDQLVADAQAFTQELVQGVREFVRHARAGRAPCTLALSAAAALVPGLEAALAAAGFTRQLRLPPGAAAVGAARIAAAKLKPLADIADAPLLTTIDLAFAQQARAAAWDVQLHPLPSHGAAPTPTHAIIEGIGHSLAGTGRCVIGLAGPGVDLALPACCRSAGAHQVTLLRAPGAVRLLEKPTDAPEAGTTIHAGDQLIIRAGNDAPVTVLFAHCET